MGKGTETMDFSQQNLKELNLILKYLKIIVRLLPLKPRQPNILSLSLSGIFRFSLKA